MNCKNLLSAFSSYVRIKLTDILENKLNRDEFIKFWHCLLRGFSLASFEAREKRFACVKYFLDGLLNVELAYRQTYDLIRRLCPALQTFRNEDLVEVCIVKKRCLFPYEFLKFRLNFVSRKIREILVVLSKYLLSLILNKQNREKIPTFRCHHRQLQ
uniref:Uncharacterized protein n=1 Tax=Glossina pallidipes TaxID=7398 RepID=A0A1B0AGS8_GLOPL